MTEAETTETAALVELSAALGSSEGRGLEEAVAQAARVAGARAVEETLLQAILFAGYPRVLAAFGLWREHVPHAEPPLEEDERSWASRGPVVCARVYGEQLERLRENVRSLHPDLERWMVNDGYGKVLGRPGLDLERRELCVAALLAAQGAYPQLHSHLRGALRAGAPTAAVEAALDAAARVSPGTTAEARRVWARVRTRTERA
ncbi:MAG: carboxymuconolactone decarboxylase family protein [Gemmatimonadota bacterium]